MRKCWLKDKVYARKWRGVASRQFSPFGEGVEEQGWLLSPVSL